MMQAAHTIRKFDFHGRVVSGIIFGALVLLSLLVRLGNLSSPLSEDHSFRQTQTAITVWTFSEGGISLWNYETPVFGAPWQVPFEFPVYQATAAILVKCGIENFDVACRIANLLYFYASAAVLYWLVCRRASDGVWPKCVVIAYVWMPFCIFWSRTAMIDFCSVFFALFYLAALEESLDSSRSTRHRSFLLIITVAAGTFAFLAKITTIVAFVLPLVFCCLKAIVQRDPIARFGFRINAIALGIGIVAAVIPYLVFSAWLAHSDRIKDSSVATAWLTSASLRGWNIPPMAHRLDRDCWLRIGHRILSDFAPGVFFCVFPIGLVLAVFRSTYRWTVLLPAFSGMAAVILFFRLYEIHNYYLIAITPALALIMGTALHGLFFTTDRSPLVGWVVTSGFVFGIYAGGREYLKPTQAITYDNCPAVAIGNAIQRHTSPSDCVVVEDNDWSSDLLYYARRRGLMWRGPITDAPAESVQGILRQGNYTLVVSQSPHPKTREYYDSFEFMEQIGPFYLHRVRVRSSCL